MFTANHNDGKKTNSQIDRNEFKDRRGNVDNSRFRNKDILSLLSQIEEMFQALKRLLLKFEI